MIFNGSISNISVRFNHYFGIFIAIAYFSFYLVHFWPMYKLAGNFYWGGWLCTVDLLVLTSLDQLIFKLEILFSFLTKQSIFMRWSTVISLLPQLVFPEYFDRASHSGRPESAVGCSFRRARGCWQRVAECCRWRTPERMEQLGMKNVNNRTAHNWHQCRKTTVLSCHRCVINSGVEKTNYI